jgi:membrane associated rhomboid family serine protease
VGYGFRRYGWGGPSYRSYGGGGISFGYGLTPVVKKLIIANAVLFVLTTLLGMFLYYSVIEDGEILFGPARSLEAAREFAQQNGGDVIAYPKLQRDFIRWFGVVPQDTAFGFRLWQPLTYLFLHAGFLHLFFNMFGLWMFGVPLERDWGGRRFLRYYLLTGVGAGVLNVIVSLLWGGATAAVPTIGASGAIYGILLAFGLLYPHTPILIWFLFPIPARVFVLIFGALAFLSALQGPGTGISHISHLGGMLFGFLLLRGRWLYHRALNRYVDWKLKQARRKFEVYLREEDEHERRGPDQWIH